MFQRTKVFFFNFFNPAIIVSHDFADESIYIYKDRGESS